MINLIGSAYQNIRDERAAELLGEYMLNLTALMNIIGQSVNEHEAIEISENIELHNNTPFQHHYQ